MFVVSGRAFLRGCDLPNHASWLQFHRRSWDVGRSQIRFGFRLGSIQIPWNKSRLLQQVIPACPRWDYGLHRSVWRPVQRSVQLLAQSSRFVAFVDQARESCRQVPVNDALSPCATLCVSIPSLHANSIPGCKCFPGTSIASAAQKQVKTVCLNNAYCRHKMNSNRLETTCEETITRKKYQVLSHWKNISESQPNPPRMQQHRSTTHSPIQTTIKRPLPKLHLVLSSLDKSNRLLALSTVDLFKTLVMRPG